MLDDIWLVGPVAEMSHFKWSFVNLLGKNTYFFWCFFLIFQHAMWENQRVFWESYPKWQISWPLKVTPREGAWGFVTKGGISRNSCWEPFHLWIPNLCQKSSVALTLSFTRILAEVEKTQDPSLWRCFL
jgi:hypothetical protein